VKGEKLEGVRKIFFWLPPGSKEQSLKLLFSFPGARPCSDFIIGECR